MTARLAPLVLLVGAASGAAADWERDPIRYSTAPADNTFNRLAPGLADGTVKLEHQGDGGHLRSLLKALKVPESSQVLVFTKTSLQRHKIGPATPRAIYFNDDVYVGFCLKGDVLEVAAPDARLGTAFYTVGQRPGNPKVQRHADNCLLCHGSSHNRGVPGHVFRSVLPERDGEPSLAQAGRRVDHTTPFAERWGGWYVTGTHGAMTHLGNQFAPDAGVDQEPGTAQNVVELAGRFKLKPYLTPHSDLVALMVLEHQGAVHNRLARATLEGRIALHQEGPGTDKVIRGLADELVDVMLFRGEAKLTAEVAGTSPFRPEFEKRGPFDRKGRSLREFDLRTRLFRYPCSYLVYADAFQKLPVEIKEAALRRLYAVLTGAEGMTEFAHLTADDRMAIREILADTLPERPEWWK